MHLCIPRPREKTLTLPGLDKTSRWTHPLGYGAFRLHRVAKGRGDPSTSSSPTSSTSFVIHLACTSAAPATEIGGRGWWTRSDRDAERHERDCGRRPPDASSGSRLRVLVQGRIYPALCRGFGGASTPPELHRLQRSTRQRARTEPTAAPLFSIAIRANVEQLGTNLQTPVGLSEERVW